MATKIKTVADELRSAKRTRADEIAELLAEDLSFLKQNCAVVAEALEAIEIEGLEALAEALAEVPAVAGHVEALTDAVASLQMVLAEIGDAESFTAFVEAYDAAEEVLFTFIDLRDADTYPGIGEERAEAWEEAVAAFDQLADAWEQVGEEGVG
jgi:hypothetical protein